MDNIRIDDFWVSRKNHSKEEFQVIGIDWTDKRYGFGRFEIVIDEDGGIYLCTESMCHGNDKEFAYELMAALIDKAIVDN